MSAPLRRWQKNFSVEDFEKNVLPRIDIDKLIETQKAQICVQKCKIPE